MSSIALTDDSHVNVAATGDSNKRGGQQYRNLPDPTHLSHLVSALTDCAGETQCARFRPLPRLCGKKKGKKKIKKFLKIGKSVRAATLPAKQLDFDRLRVSAEVSSNFI